MKALATEVYAEAFEGVSEEDRAIMLSVLIRVSANLNQRALLKEELA